MEEKLINMIKSTLEIECDSYFDKLPIPCAVVDIYSTSPGLGSVIDEHGVQVDLWYKAKEPFEQASKKLFYALKKERYYSYPYMEKYFDNEAKLFRAIYKFYIIESEES